MTALQLCYAIAMLSRITAASWRASHRCWDQINGNWWHDIFFGWDSLVDETDLRCVSWKELCKCIWTLLLLFMQANLLDVKRCQKGLLIFRMKLHHMYGSVVLASPCLLIVFIDPYSRSLVLWLTLHQIDLLENLAPPHTVGLHTAFRGCP